MRKLGFLSHAWFAIALSSVLSVSVNAQLSDVTQPGDAIIASSGNSPGSEGVANAIDNQPTKYLNFDSGRDGTNAGFSPSGFVVTPSVGVTHVTGLSMTSANDAEERDPIDVTLEGSNDETIADFNSGTWEVITQLSGYDLWTARFEKLTFSFANGKTYKHYRWTVNATRTTPNGCCMQIAEVELLGTTLPRDVTQPGDPIIASSGNSPGSEGVANAIDNQPTKYLNFDSGRDGTNAGFSPSGFVVSPSIGRTLVTGLTMQSANDAEERDPTDVTLEGSNDETIADFNSGTWEVITQLSGYDLWTARFQTLTFLFENARPYRHYRWTVNATRTTPNGCCMQIAEVELLGTSAPRDVTQPGDPIIASSANSPGSEGVANAIDNQPTKYLNFDSGRDGTNAGFSPSGFVVSPRIGPTTVIGLTMQSANDAEERDPIDVTLEGSNDETIADFNSGNWELITQLSGYDLWTARFQTLEFFFANSISYRHYRWTVNATRTTPNGCCMQIAEVELLAVPRGGNTNPVETLIRRQPQDTPVLLGAQATFRVLLTGPWIVQWYKDGVAIPGASSESYTTPATTEEDDGAIFHAVVESAEGTQVSDQIMLSIFTPSPTESVGLSWRGAGANGAPTDMFPTDITGFHQQAYWNNLMGAGGGPVQVTTSSNRVHETVMVMWQTSSEWGSGTGNQDATERMLNGMTRFPDGGADAPQSVTFSGVPSGSHALLLYTVQVPLEFFNMDFTVTTYNADGTPKTVQNRFIRPQNADEYNPSPGFILVTAESAATRSVGNMMRFEDLQTDNGVIQLDFHSPGRFQPQGGEPVRGPGLNGLQLLLNSPPAGAPPTIAEHPVSANGIVGGQVTLSVEASGPDLTYQWLKNGQPIRGATGAQLRLANLNTNDGARYSVAISNPAGRVVSKIAVVGVLETDEVGEGLKVYFKLDDGEGAINTMMVTNSAADGQDGEVRGTNPFPDTPEGQIGLALSMGETHVFVPNYEKPSEAVTVAGWVSGTSDQWGPIINNWLQASPIGSRGQFRIEINLDAVTSAPVLRAEIGVGPNQPAVSAQLDALLMEWHHFAMTADGSTLSLYWDGMLVATTDYLGLINNIATLPWLALGAELTAADPATLPARTFSGAIDDIALWCRSLSDVEIQAIYNAGLSDMDISQVPPVFTVPPRLTITRTEAGIIISWPAEETGFTLVTSPSLTDPVWTPVMDVVNNSVTIANPTGTAFFQLQQ